MKINILPSLIALWVITTGLTCQKNSGVKNLYNISETLTFDNVQYKLVASYHPNDIYYKQEYIPAGESAGRFNKMILIDFAITDASAREMLDIKAKEMQDRKKSDPVVNYEVMENNAQQEYILDFILSDGKGEKVNVVERNVYHYKNYLDRSGHKGVLLFGISQRGYDNGIPSFFTNLKKTRMDDINKVGLYPIPDIDIK